MDSRIENFARARIAVERIFGGKNQEIFDAAERDLHDSYQRWEAARAEALGVQIEQMDVEIDGVRAEAADVTARLERARTALAEAGPDADIDLLRANIKAYEAWERESVQKVQEMEAQKAEVIKANEAESMNQLNKIQQRVDASMLEQREAKYPRLAKFNDWAKKHPKTRIAIGAALAGASVIGAITGNIPLVVAAMSGRAAMAGYGGYNVMRGFGERRATKKFSQTEIESIQDYTTAAESQSKIRRRSKKAGAALGAGLAAIPIAKGINTLSHIMDVPDNVPTDTGVVKPPTPTDVGTVKPPTPIDTVAPPSPQLPTWTPDLSVPNINHSTYVHNILGNWNDTNRVIPALAERAQKYGINIVGNGKGGGLGGIISVNGSTDDRAINSALKFVAEQEGGYQAVLNSLPK